MYNIFSITLPFISFKFCVCCFLCDLYFVTRQADIFLPVILDELVFVFFLPIPPGNGPNGYNTFQIVPIRSFVSLLITKNFLWLVFLRNIS